MDLVLSSAYRLGLLAVPVLLGVVAARVRLFQETERAVSSLNVFALYFGFPALVFVGIVDARFSLPEEPLFWLFVPLTQLPLIGVLRVVLRGAGRGEQTGTLALCTLFGNVAYLGLPLCTALFGAEWRGTIAVAVSIHVALAVGLGPLLLRIWSGARASVDDVRGVLRQPLLWAPLAGLLGRALPGGALDVLREALVPLAAAAAPVALFLLGLYLHTRREALHGRHPGATLHVLVKLVLAPTWALAVAVVAVRLGQLAPTEARIFVLLAGMPAAITTFSIAHFAGLGQERIAAVIVRTSIACVVTLPALFAISGMLAP